MVVTCCWYLIVCCIGAVLLLTFACVMHWLLHWLYRVVDLWLSAAWLLALCWYWIVNCMVVSRCFYLHVCCKLLSRCWYALVWSMGSIVLFVFNCVVHGCCRYVNIWLRVTLVYRVVDIPLRVAWLVSFGDTWTCVPWVVSCCWYLSVSNGRYRVVHIWVCVCMCCKRVDVLRVCVCVCCVMCLVYCVLCNCMLRVVCCVIRAVCCVSFCVCVCL